MPVMENILIFSLIVMRISGCILFGPIFGRRNVVPIIKAGIILALSLILISYSKYEPIEVQNSIEYSFLLLKEFAIGFILGNATNLFLYIIVFAGEIIDMQLGLSMAKIYDAQSNSSIALTSTFFNILFMLLFFSSDAHLALMRLFLNSSQVLPYGTVVIGNDLVQAMITMFCDCTILAVKMAMPILASELIVEVGVGILMKTIPQINVFVVNIQMKLIFGFFVLVLIFSPMSDFIDGTIESMFHALQNILTFM